MKLICEVIFLKSLLALILSLFMLGSGGNVKNVVIHEVSSDIYSQEEISAAAAMNRLRWGTGDAALEAKWMKLYLSERVEFLDSLWLKNEHYCKVTVFLEDGVRLRYYARASGLHQYAVCHLRWLV